MACDGGQIKAAATGIRGATTSRGRADDRAASTPVELGPEIPGPAVGRWSRGGCPRLAAVPSNGKLSGGEAEVGRFGSD